MKVSFIILPIIFFINCNPIKQNYTINIRSIVFLDLLNKFDSISSEIMQEKNNIISVNIQVDSMDTIVGLYANKKLKPEYYIGYTMVDSIKVFFYSNSRNSINEFYEILSQPEIIVNENWDYSNVYTEYYKFKQGKFIFIKPS